MLLIKKSLTNTIVFLTLILLDLNASTYKWSAKIDKKTAYINEAVLLTFVCEFSDNSELYTIDFNPVQNNQHFSIKLLKASQVLKNSKRVNTYEFLAYAKKEGFISFDFDIVMKQTTQDSINSTTNGHYDDSKLETFTSTPIKHLPLCINIKAAPSQLVGEFTLKVKQDIPKLQAYEPYNLEIQIEGVGNFSTITSIDFSIDGVKIFTQAKVLKTDFTQDGQKGIWSQKFSFVSDKSFEIPAVFIDYLDVKQGTLKILKFEGMNVKIDEDVYKKVNVL
ncbi:BatD family protein, partial [Sulfurimonas sp. SAG-AH-194-C20]